MQTDSPISNTPITNSLDASQIEPQQLADDDTDWKMKYHETKQELEICRRQLDEVNRENAALQSKNRELLAAKGGLDSEGETMMKEFVALYGDGDNVDCHIDSKRGSVIVKGRLFPHFHQCKTGELQFYSADFVWRADFPMMRFRGIKDDHAPVSLYHYPKLVTKLEDLGDLDAFDGGKEDIWEDVGNVWAKQQHAPQKVENRDVKSHVSSAKGGPSSEGETMMKDFVALYGDGENEDCFIDSKRGVVIVKGRLFPHFNLCKGGELQFYSGEYAWRIDFPMHPIRGLIDNELGTLLYRYPIPVTNLEDLGDLEAFDGGKQDVWEIEGSVHVKQRGGKPQKV